MANKPGKYGNYFLPERCSQHCEYKAHSHLHNFATCTVTRPQRSLEKQEIEKDQQQPNLIMV